MSSTREAAPSATYAATASVIKTIAVTEQKISSLEIQSLSADDQALVTQAISSLKNTLEIALKYS
ncbi:MAG: hypothetical protein WCJ37_17705 [Syntrophus sp. (in: bacteria)]